MAYVSSRPQICCPPPLARPSLLTYLDVYRSRRQLARLDDQALADIGVTRAEAQAEAERPIWDLPENRD